jgi:hypothetical protein
VRNAVCTGLAAVALAGCGGGDEKKPKAPDPAVMKGQDAVAKSRVRESIAYLEACYVDRNSYMGCPSGNSAVSATTTDGTYVLRTRSQSGAEFVATKAYKVPLKRTCTPAGRGGCGVGGVW